MTRGLLLALTAFGASAAIADGSPRIELSTSPIASLHAALRIAAAKEPDASRPEGMQRAAVMYREVTESLTSTLASAAPGTEEHGGRSVLWQPLDGAIFSATDLDELEQRASLLSAERPGPLTGALPRIVEALKTAWPDYTRLERPAASSPEQRIAWWNEQIGPRLPPVYQFLARQLGIPSLPETIRVLVVPEMPDPGGGTYRTRNGALAVVGAANYEGSAFVEAVVHESLHVLDASSQESLFSDLRKALKLRGADAEASRQLPHVLMFLLAAESVKRFVEPAHVPVGERFGAYARGLDRYRHPVEPLLGAYLAGELDRAAFVARAVDAIASAPGAPPTSANRPGS